jgi:hypothetical protein
MGTLHRGSQITNWSSVKSNNDKYTVLISGLGFFYQESDGVREGGALGASSLILIPLEDFPVTFLIFF